MGTVAQGRTHMGALGPPNLEGKRPWEARLVVWGKWPEKALLVRGALELVP